MVDFEAKGAAKVRAKIAEAERRVQAGHKKILRAWARTVQAAERRYARAHHRQTGRFASNIKVYQDHPGEAKVKAVGPVAHLVLSPTAAHEITPKNMRAIVVGGQPVASANHPGSAGDPFLREVADEVQTEAMLAAREEYLHGP